MTILPIKIGQWLGPLRAVFPSGLFGSRWLRQWLDLCCHMHTPFILARFSKSSIPFDLTDCLQGAAFVYFFQDV
jgi:hypothetical protein